MAKTSNIRTVDFLPDIFKTKVNGQFLAATLDTLTSKPDVTKISGYIGRKYGYGVSTSDPYVNEISDSRYNYQLEPSVVQLNPVNGKAKDTISYPEIIDSLRGNGVNVDNPSKLFDSEYYTWDSFVDLDKLVNYGQYYWLPFGTDPIITSDNISLIEGQSAYTTTEGFALTNGVKLKIEPETYIVEGVGASIKLVKFSDLFVVEKSSSEEYIPYASTTFDASYYDAMIGIAKTPDYITINRAATNKNAWSRYNRWVHVDAITSVAKFNNTEVILDSTQKAKRPIIEFRPNLTLFNMGKYGQPYVDFFDTTLTDINQFTVSHRPDGQNNRWFEGATVIFSVSGTKNIIYKVIDIGGNLQLQQHGICVNDASYPIRRGDVYSGKTMIFKNQTWTWPQQKNTVNQPPLFDVFDSNGVSFGDKSHYQLTTFAGSKLFSYMLSDTSSTDTVLGLPIKYSGATVLGDVVFESCYNADQFEYHSTTQNVKVLTRNGYVHEQVDDTEISKLNGWTKSTFDPVQYQIFENVTLSNLDFSPSGPTYVCDIAPRNGGKKTRVYQNNILLDASQYDISVMDGRTTIEIIDNSLSPSEPLTIMIDSLQKSNVAYYELPIQLQFNPLNSTIRQLSMGEVRLHYQSIFKNTPSITGNAYGTNTYRDMGNIESNGDKIIKNSCSFPLMALMLKNSSSDFLNSLAFSSDMYSKFKDVIVKLVEQTEFTIYHSSSAILDEVMSQYTMSYGMGTEFGLSDMLPCLTPSIEKSYTISTQHTLTTSNIYDFSNPTQLAVLLYRTESSIVTQMIRGIDYNIEGTTITLLKNESGNTITVREYNSTAGNYVPSTPTKLGMYPSYVPEIMLDDSYLEPTWFIKGHDGSLTKVFGQIIDGVAIDFRDKVLLEFETRVYNNLKVKTPLLQVSDIVPGFFRKTDYSRDDILEFSNSDFMNWSGKNRIDYKTQYFIQSEPKTYNYKISTNQMDGTQMVCGNWRGIYLQFYDTATPHLTPWEMLGLTIKPNWWDARYGNAPYTSLNTLLWDDLSAGRVWNAGTPFIDSRYVRTGLEKIIPVDQAGNLKPVNRVLIANYDSLTRNHDWEYGDVSPSEYSYRKSSDYPFDMVKLMAHLKPLKFFTYFAKTTDYEINQAVGQFGIAGNHFMLSDVNLDDSINPTGYLTYFMDYYASMGKGYSSEINSRTQYLDTRLSYKMAGFIDSDTVSFATNSITVNGSNDSLLIPQESYAILLHNNEPFDKIKYSSVIIQKTDRGYKIYGNSQNAAYFEYRKPILTGDYEMVPFSETYVRLSHSYSSEISVMPYGTELLTLSQVSDFLMGYGKLQSDTGLKFDVVEKGIELSWRHVVDEFLYWVLSGWAAGSVINLNPIYNKLEAERDSAIVQPLTLHSDNFILDQNSIPVALSDMYVYREGTKFVATPLKDGTAFAYFRANLSNIEHVVVFDNTSIFGDTLYDPLTGMRQIRISINGIKTNNWDGTITTGGFILNQDNVLEWRANTKYTKGIIVTYKNSYWISNEVLPPANRFDETKWTKTDYSAIQKGLLPNPNTKSYESDLYYSAYKETLTPDMNQLGRSLIGYRQRPYFQNTTINDKSQFNFMRSVAKIRGTNISVNSLSNANINGENVEYDIYENWAIKTSDFGGVMNKNYIDIKLNDDMYVHNPSVIQITGSNDLKNADEYVNVKQLYGYARPPQSQNILPLINTFDYAVPYAGYVNINEVKAYAYDYSGLQNGPTPTSIIYRGDYVWIADDNGTWQIYTPITVTNDSNLITDSVPVHVIGAINNFDDTVDITMSSVHDLVENERIMITLFDYRVDGYYKVRKVVNPYIIQIDLVLDKQTTKMSGQGIITKFKSRRIDTVDSLSSIDLVDALFEKTKVWVDSNETGKWEVLIKTPMLEKYLDFSVTSDSSNIFPVGKNTILVASPEFNKVDQYNYSTFADSYKLYQTLLGNSQYGKHIKVIDGNVMIASNNEFFLYDSRMDMQASAILPSGEIISSISVSTNATYVACVCVSGRVVVYRKKNGSMTLVSDFVHEYDTNGSSITVSPNADRIVITSPSYDAGEFNSESGIAVVYDRFTFAFESPHDTLNSQSYTIPFSHMNYVACVKNGVDITNLTTFNSNILTISTMVTMGDLIQVESNLYSVVQTIQSADIGTKAYSGRKYGTSIASLNQMGNLLIGAPYEILQLNKASYEGIVHHYLDSGKVNGELIVELADMSGVCNVYINGFAVVARMDTTDNFVTDVKIADIQNVTANKLDEKRVRLSIKNMTLAQKFNALSLSFIDSTNRAKIKYVPYSLIQDMNNPYFTGYAGFGHTILSDGNMVIINSTESKAVLRTTFDFIDNVDTQDDTIFDNNFTGWTDTQFGRGSTIVYELVAGKLSPIQLLSTTGNGKKSISIGNGAAIIASSGGQIVVYSVNGDGWQLHDEQTDQVDVSRLNASIYNEKEKETVFLDTVDPLNGKFHGVVASNLDFTTSYDPAGYTSKNSSTTWQSDFVGSIWFDTSAAKFMDYRHSNVEYNYSIWANPIPGSKVNVYTWVESDSSPAEYTDGVPRNLTDYTLTYALNGDDSLREKYYFWAKVGKILKRNKTLSDLAIESYLADPLNSGLPYFVGLAADQIALFNVADSLNSNAILRVSFSDGKAGNQVHVETDLLRDGVPTDFLDGLPLNSSTSPIGLYRKFINSFVGSDDFGYPLPDTNLPESVRYGVLDYPRQTMFKNNQLALKNYITYFNSILKNIPYFEMGQSSMLFKNDFYYDVTNYWEYSDWIKDGYDISVLSNAYPVDHYYELESLIPSAGMFVKVNNPGQDYEVYSYLNGEWIRVLKRNATLQFKSSLYDFTNNSIGYDNQLYDSIPYDNVPVEEIRYIIRAINEEICDIFPSYRNSGMILMFNYILSESSSVPDWLTKTSLIDVEQFVRKLSESPRYQIDNTDVINGYIEDSKPYHVVIKDFTFKYSLSDEVYIGSTDFDLPSQYLNETYVTPQLIYTHQMDGNDAQFYPDDAIWKNDEYKNWFAYKGISVTKDTTAIVIRLADSISENDTVIMVDNASGIPEYGTLTIDTETMSYQVTDRDNGILTVDRGFDAGMKKPHDFMSDIVIPVGSIIVLNSGNGYDSTSSASLVTGSTGPATPAILEIKTLNGKIIDIVVLSEGYGYHDTPTVTISGGDGTAKAIVRPSNGKTRAMLEEIRLDRVSYSNTAKTWESAQFYNAKRKAKSTMNAASTFALYNSFTYNSVGSVGINGTGATFDVVVPLYAYPTNIANGTIVTSTSSNVVIGTGTDFNALEVGYTLWSHDGFKVGIIESIDSATQLTLVNDAMIYMNSQHFMYAFGEMIVHPHTTGTGYAVGDTVMIYGNDIGGTPANDITITITSVGVNGEVFDFTYSGVSPIEYISNISTSSVGDGKAILPIKAVSNSSGTTLTVDYSSSDINPSMMKNLQIAVVEQYTQYRNVSAVSKYPYTIGSSATFNVGSTLYTEHSPVAEYYVTVNNSGIGYHVNDVLIIDGSMVGGIDVTNDIELIVTAVDMDGGILSMLVNGTSSVKVKMYYAYPATSNTIKLYSDIKCTDKVTDLEITITDGICIFETIPIQADIVYYGSNLFECMVSNNDLVFDFNKWKKLKLTDYRISAAERIKYATGSDDVAAYMIGASYDGLTLIGPRYDSLITPPQTITSSYDDATDHTFIDADYLQGYGPEELVPAIISDELVILVYSSEFTLSSGELTHPVQAFSEDLSELQFRIVIDKNGNQHIHRIFSENVDALLADIDQEDDVVQVEDVLGMMINESFEAAVQDEASVKFVKLEDFVSPFRGDIKYVKLTNLTTNLEITSFYLEEHTPDYRIVIEEVVATGDIIDVQLYCASEIMVGNERMTLVTVDPVANTMKVARGLFTAGKLPHSTGDLVYTFGLRNRLALKFNSTQWNSYEYSYEGDPLQLSTSDAANFLRGIE